MHSYICNTCSVIGLYQRLHPELDYYFIEYNTPFIATLFVNDFQFLSFIENLESNLQQELAFREPEDQTYLSETGNCRHTAVAHRYPVGYLGATEIHFVHEPEDSFANIRKKFKHQRTAV